MNILLILFISIIHGLIIWIILTYNFHYFCEKNNSILIKLFLKFNKNLLNSKDQFGIKPINYIYYNKNVKLIKYLVKNYNMKLKFPYSSVEIFRLYKKYNKIDKTDLCCNPEIYKYIKFL